MMSMDQNERADNDDIELIPSSSFPGLSLTSPSSSTSASPLSSSSPSSSSASILSFFSTSSCSSSSSSTSSSSSVITSGGNKRVYGQSSLRLYTKEGKQLEEDADNAQVDFFLHAGVPFLVADSPKLHAWIQVVRRSSRDILSRKQLAKRAQQRVEDVMTRVTYALRQSAGVSVGVDGWTNVRHEKVINLCPVSRGKAYYWDSKVLKQGASALEQTPLVLQGLQSLIEAKVTVAAIVTDNESVNGALYRELRTSLPFLLHIPCAAHTIQLCVKAIMRLKPMQPVIKSFSLLLSAFKGNKLLRSKVKLQQSLLRVGHSPLQILYPCDTRWNSMLYAAERILLLSSCIRPYIDLIRDHLIEKDKDEDPPLFDDDSFWTPLHTLVSFLTTYQKATDVVQSDSATLKDVHHQFIKITEAADVLRPPHPYAPMRMKVIRQIRKQWEKHVAIDAVNSVLFFSLDDIYQKVSSEAKGRARDWFLNWGVEFLVYYRRHRFVDDPPSTHAVSVESVLTGQYSDFKSGQGTFSTFRHRYDALKGNAKQTWELYSENEIATCVLALFNITASEAAVERSFSRQGLIHSKLRNRLADSSVQQSMRFSFNTRALDSPLRADHGLCMELADDEVAEEGNGMELLSSALEDEEVAAAEEEAASEEEQEEEEKESEEEEEAKGGEEGNVEDSKDEVSEPRLPKRRRLIRLETSEEPDEQEVRKRQSRQRRSALSTPLTVDEVIDEWILEKGETWNAQLRTVLEGRLLTHGVPITIDVVEAMLKRRLSERQGV